MGGTARGLHALKHAGIASLLGRASALVAAQAKAGIVLYLFAGGCLSMLVGNAAAALLAVLQFLADPLVLWQTQPRSLAGAFCVNVPSV